MENLIDLHTHSYISDGSCSPTDVIKAAKKNKLKAISLTDHDSIAGLKEAKIAAEDSNIELINGIEISALYKDGRLLHILGLGIDIHNEYFLNSYNKMKKAREKSVPKILKHIENNHGLSIDINIKLNTMNIYLDMIFTDIFLKIIFVLNLKKFGIYI